MILMQEKSK